MRNEIQRALEEQLEAFRQKFGRDPGEEDPLFFDPEADDPRPIDAHACQEEIAATMALVGIAPKLIHAFRRTGLLVSEENYGTLSEADREAWQAALDEYEELELHTN